MMYVQKVPGHPPPLLCPVTLTIASFDVVMIVTSYTGYHPRRCEVTTWSKVLTIATVIIYSLLNLSTCHNTPCLMFTCRSEQLLRERMRATGNGITSYDYICESDSIVVYGSQCLVVDRQTVSLLYCTTCTYCTHIVWCRHIVSMCCKLGGLRGIVDSLFLISHFLIHFQPH